ncbi:lysine methyltransferase Set8 (predicted) [Sugiyamaella lignohabitans]|uniref:Lysine methyltransferase Set8 (Predicted) n=1 Tax=Sugiyamaella lignohabitans TaxID=796027 RepID=A0A167CFT3_9ASCO|nr:lysine methyltransferase Set8 (predicted) [Sugiyamaella lignohabitans]ANB11633.1 lysine methyltransferase Set8 (predicted) [Sugiyamaella lignohabitans]
MSTDSSSTLVEWAKESGIELNNCEIRKTENSGNGVFFKGFRSDKKLDGSDIEHPLLKIPKQLIITKDRIVQLAETRPFLKNLLYKTNTGDNQQTTTPEAPNARQSLARFLIYLILSSRRGTPDYEFGSWLALLPPGKDIDLPFTYPDDDLDEIERSSIFDAVIAKKTNLRLSYEDFFSNADFRKQIAEYVNSGENKNLRQIDTEVTYHDWQLVEEWILSRSLNLPVITSKGTSNENGKSKDNERAENEQDEDNENENENEDEIELEIALVPILDMCNHATDANARYEVEDEGNVVLLFRDNLSIEDIEKLTDKEITISYGSDKSAGEFLFTYGFIPEGYKTAKELSRFYSVEDTNIVKLLDPDNYSKSEDRIPYAFLTNFLDRPVNRFQISYPSPESPYPRWHDDLLFLLACEDNLLVHKNDEEGYLELYYSGYEVDLNDVERFLLAVDRTKFLTEIVPRADSLAEKFLQAVLTQIELGGEIGSSADIPRTSQHELIKLEIALIEETIKGIEHHKQEVSNLKSHVNLDEVNKGLKDTVISDK